MSLVILNISPNPHSILYYFCSKKRSLQRHPMDQSYAKAFYEQQDIRNENTSTIRKQYQQSSGRDRNDYARIWEMPLPQSPTSGEGMHSDVESRRTISPYGYGYRTDLSPNYQMHPNGSFTNFPYGKREHQEIAEDPRYFQLDPEQPNPQVEQPYVTTDTI